MSIRVMSKVWEMDLPAKDKLVLLALADCANDEGLAWPSIATLARKCGCDERTVQRNLRDLEKLGIFTRDEIKGKGCRYIFNPRQIATPGNLSRVTKSTPTPGKLPPNPSVTVNEGLADAKPKRASKSDLPEWLPAEQWAAFLDMRKRKRANPTPRAIGLLLADLERWRANGHDPGAILDNSTKNNWTGLFEPKEPANDRLSRSPDRSLPRGGDRRDGVARALDRRLGLDGFAEPLGRRDAGEGGSDSEVAPPRLGYG